MKKSGYLAKLQARQERELQEARVYALQMGLDVGILALANEFGFGAERLNRFRNRYQEIWDEYQALINGDSADCEYAFAKMDEALKDACGEYYAPREERYG